MAIDYKILLKKYMDHVASSEGTDFTDFNLEYWVDPDPADCELTKAEAEELMKLSKQVIYLKEGNCKL